MKSRLGQLEPSPSERCRCWLVEVRAHQELAVTEMVERLNLTCGTIVYNVLLKRMNEDNGRSEVRHRSYCQALTHVTQSGFGDLRTRPGEINLAQRDPGILSPKQVALPHYGAQRTSLSTSQNKAMTLDQDAANQEQVPDQNFAQRAKDPQKKRQGYQVWYTESPLQGGSAG
ncbi:hypothetical protein CB1_002798018 [Camelus ferus]|nr:hypothetical protein CB1_002798018 [Camelus ferus]